jgi:Zn-dependent M28 family amino/carboxypeptidase
MPRTPRSLSTTFLLPLLALAACGGESQSTGPIDGQRAMAHVEKLVGLGPRPFGSEALGKATDYLEGELKAMGLSPKRHEEMHETEKRLIRNLYVQIDGEDPEKGPILIYGAHYDTKLTDGHGDAAHNFPFVGAIDGGGGPAVLLEMARELKSRPQKPKVNVWLYFIDAEESLDFIWNDDRALLGSKAFCKMLATTPSREQSILRRVKAFVLLDLIGSKNFKIDRDGNSNTRLQEIFERAGAAIGCADRMYEFPTKDELAFYQSRGIKWGTKDDHETFLGYGIPSVLLIDFARRIPPHLQQLQPGQQPERDARFEQWWHTPDDTLEAMDPKALAFAGNLALAALPDLENFCLGKK